MINKVNRLTSYVIRLGGRYLNLARRVDALEKENDEIVEALARVTLALQQYQNILANVAQPAEQSICRQVAGSTPVVGSIIDCDDPSKYQAGTYVGESVQCKPADSKPVTAGSSPASPANTTPYCPMGFANCIWCSDTAFGTLIGS